MCEPVSTILVRPIPPPGASPKLTSVWNMIFKHRIYLGLPIHSDFVRRIHVFWFCFSFRYVCDNCFSYTNKTHRHLFSVKTKALEESSQPFPILFWSEKLIFSKCQHNFRLYYKRLTAGVPSSSVSWDPFSPCATLESRVCFWFAPPHTERDIHNVCWKHKNREWHVSFLT